MDRTLTEAERHPLLNAAGRKMLQRLQEHPHAPRYNHRCGDRLDAAGLERVHAFARAHQTAPRGWKWGEPPGWVRNWAAFCLRESPIYRRRGGSPDDFAALPAVGREDLGREPWAFVPDNQSLENLIVYDTSGRTGHPIELPSHPETAALYLPLMQAALASRGVTWKGGEGKVALFVLCAQRMTWTFATVSSYLEQAGVGKINLHPTHWHQSEDRAKFLDDCNAEIYCGDPIAFMELMRIPLHTRPRALVSTAMTLLPGLAANLEAHFGCPVLDLYSLNETGPVGMRTDRGFTLLPHDLYVEILDAEGRPCPPCVRGEITLTGGRNPFLPLLRYQTGDWGALDFTGEVPCLVDLDGRPPVLFRDTSGGMVNNIDISWAMKPFALSQFALHQDANGNLTLRARGPFLDENALRQALQTLFGADQTLSIVPITEGDKVLQYTSDLA